MYYDLNICLWQQCASRHGQAGPGWGRILRLSLTPGPGWQRLSSIRGRQSNLMTPSHQRDLTGWWLTVAPQWA